MFAVGGPGAEAQTAPQGTRTAQATTESRSRSRPVRRGGFAFIPATLAEPDGVYPRYNPGPNAVRVCNASYVQEFRPSGTVIVPHMTCVWRRG